MTTKLKRKHVTLALVLPLLLSSLNGSFAGAAALPTTVTPQSAPSWGYFVDNYQNNITANNMVSSNPAIGTLSKFLDLWTPGDKVTDSVYYWKNGTKVNPGVLDANMQYVANIAATRTADQETAAYLDDRRNQTYSVTEGLGSLTDVYRSKSGTYTTIQDVAADATTKKYDDGNSSNAAGNVNSELGKMVTLIGTVRGNYASGNPSKNFYQYPRPWRQLGENVLIPTLIPAKSSTPASDGGFPSGHTNAAYLAAFSLAYAVPERFQELLTRASELGNNRIVTGMHSPLDVMGGRVLATAMAAATLNDPANAAIKQAAYDNAHANLLTQTGTAEDRFSDYVKNKKEYTGRLTYGFNQINATMNPMVVPKGAEVLLETRLPYLDNTQRRWVLATTGIPSGYPLLDDTEGWGRLNLFAAADGYGAFVGDVTVTMDAYKGGFHALDRWRNDISGTGKLTKGGTGTLKLQGDNTYSGGTQITDGILDGDSNTAFGTGDVAVTGGAMIENVAGTMTIGASYTQSAEGALELNLGSNNDLLEIKGDVSLNGKLRLNFTNNYVPDNGIVTIITHGKDRRNGQFSSVETTGLPSGYTVKVIYDTDSIRVKVTNDTAPPSWPEKGGLTSSNVGQTSLTLNWPAATDESGVAGYSVYRDALLIGTVPGTTYSYTLTDLIGSTSYSFSVVAYDLEGNQSSPLNASFSTDGRRRSSGGGSTGSSASNSGETVSNNTDPAGTSSLGTTPAVPPTSTKPGAPTASTGISAGSPSKLFSDVDGTYSWAVEAIDTLASKGIIQGTSDKMFAPDKRISRADVVLLLVRALDLKSEFTSNFSDVAKEDYYYEALGTAKQLGLVNGLEGTTFGPKQDVTREDLMLLCARAFMLAGHDVQANTADLSQFTDHTQISPYAAEGVAFLVKKGIVEGNGHEINPSGAATRAETAVMIYRMVNMK
ncbi:S-layer homology domain-containing protein [Paenibacillus rigui]|uniref:Phosphoesterase n=1 Tax=Paenibacillus rigui TaxID=554312 RepID=A0A229UUJ1_9BACL|nr:S-layer homology domain-containing protein [Paenibacillus rigui]OXM87050.1 phosphoesterase [Paenibacillus rigui]